MYILKTESREVAEEICQSGKQLFTVTQHRPGAWRKEKSAVNGRMERLERT